ncbi:YdaS family helix-turn-helix protein [Microbulbifer sp. HZ11]|uniref:transcriptional regulator n=1 Tax=Microbulbifer sp. HZ11 TaxID=1453501 RepID=UPI0005BD89A1|nr:YdaS family helix-turn-helix protein [Microbulbifer sp. HZ11]
MNKLNQVEEAAKKLVEHFGGQVAAANALQVKQPTISNLVRGKHGASAELALRAELATGGAVKAYQLCPKLAGLYGGRPEEPEEVREAS